MPSIFRRSLLCKTCTGLAFAIALVTGPTQSFAADCTNSPAHEAFDVAGLKSELMVTALSCKTQDRYNAFVSKFRPALLDAENRLNTYFRDTYGRRAQAAHDDYVTQLADIQSLGGLKSGTVFCAQREAMFDETAALQTASDLAHYAEAKDVAQPASYETCSAPAATDRRSRHGEAKSTTRHRSHKG
ncbi:hypothetical protein [Neokomagataea thailandica]|nr:MULTISPECIES: hypothetical protein [Neokomagataea]